MKTWRMWAAAHVIGALFLTDGSREALAGPKSYGCFKVVGASSIAIRKSPWTWAPIVGYAKRGQKLVKRKRFCSVRPWCPVRSGDITGWSGKRYLAKVAC